jgi:hypothetical protein
MEPKCKDCNMPKRIKDKNISIVGDSGACSICHTLREAEEPEGYNQPAKRSSYARRQ